MAFRVGYGSEKGRIRNTFFWLENKRKIGVHTWLPGPAGSGGLAAPSPAAASLTRKVESGSGMDFKLGSGSVIIWKVGEGPERGR
jgi:hypothetical protein